MTLLVWDWMVWHNDSGRRSSSKIKSVSTHSLQEYTRVLIRPPQITILKSKEATCDWIRVCEALNMPDAKSVSIPSTLGMCSSHVVVVCANVTANHTFPNINLSIISQRLPHVQLQYIPLYYLHHPSLFPIKTPLHLPMIHTHTPLACHYYLQHPPPNRESHYTDQSYYLWLLPSLLPHLQSSNHTVLTIFIG